MSSLLGNHSKITEGTPKALLSPVASGASSLGAQTGALGFNQNEPNAEKIGEKN